MCSHFNHIFAPADIRAPPTFMLPEINNSVPVEPPPALAPATAPPPIEKSAPDATKKPGKSSASNQSQCSNDDEFWESRVGVYAFIRNPDPDTPPDVRARTTVNHINSFIGDSPGLKARPVVVPGTGFAKFTIVCNEILTCQALQDLLKNGVFITPDFPAREPRDRHRSARECGRYHLHALLAVCQGSLRQGGHHRSFHIRTRRYPVRHRGEHADRYG